MAERVSFDPSEEPTHWFVLDVAIARQRAVTLVGPFAAEVFAPVDRQLSLEALIASIDWHREHEPASHGAVLNACRAWLFAEEGVWASKADSAAWAMPRAASPTLLETAIALRRRRAGGTLDEAKVRSFVDGVRARVLDATADRWTANPPPS